MKGGMNVGCLVLLIATLLSSGVDGAPKSGCDDSSCRKTGIFKYYSELNCQPIYEDNNCCPVKFDCSKLTSRSINKCHYKGEEYEVQSRIPTNDTVKHCLAACGCYSNDDKAKFNCAHIECPELFNGPLKERGCFRQYSVDTCCSVSTLCMNETSEEGNKKVHQCEYGGKKFYKGQKFYPNGECKTCVCDEEYDGSTTGPWCREFECNVELTQGRRIDEGCVPVFYSNGCCPVGWRCPSANDTVVHGPNHETPPSGTQESDDSQAFCSFGTLKLFLQDKLSDDSENSECSCIIPPFLTCNLKPRSEE